MKIAVFAVIVLGMVAAGFGQPVAPFGVLAVAWGATRYRKMSFPPPSWPHLIGALLVLFIAVACAVQFAIQLIR